MNSQYRTYMKREIKKTYPLLIVGLLFLVFMAVITTSMTKGVYEGALLELSDHFTSHGVWGMGDVAAQPLHNQLRQVRLTGRDGGALQGVLV